ncbi:conserved hypothetical protein [Coccidioides posadasii str. Silveira]|uniref:Uncharacterized protein n=1 Tax=Coccidioides posadasii (strain RMSCC 757 / Silveira) TaxID=443226 RepID=E9CV13_COCPS|nr:conserved hypothetical protein [Coccidioides posadasii str. Silveira]
MSSGESSKLQLYDICVWGGNLLRDDLLFSRLGGIFGPPGSPEKGALADDCARATEYNMYHFSVCASMGETCRSTDPDAKSIRDHTNNPDLLPGEVILNLLQPKMDKEEGGGRWIVRPGVAILLNCPER